MIPLIDSAALFAGPSPAREEADRRNSSGCDRRRLPDDDRISGRYAHGATSRGGACCASSICRKARSANSGGRSSIPRSPNVYRGWFPLQSGHATYKEGIDMGRDVAYGAGIGRCERSAAGGDPAAAGRLCCPAGARMLPIIIASSNIFPPLSCARSPAAWARRADIRRSLCRRSFHLAADPLSAALRRLLRRADRRGRLGGA